MKDRLVYNRLYSTWDKPEAFETKDSGVRLTFDSGMVRDTEDGKTDYTLVLDGPMFERWAALLSRGAVKYEKRNWMKARGEAELDRFKQSAFRHFIQWMNGENDEDHASAVLFNINGAEYVRSRQLKERAEDVIKDPTPNPLANRFRPEYPMSPVAKSTEMPEMPGTGGDFVRS